MQYLKVPLTYFITGTIASEWCNFYTKKNVICTKQCTQVVLPILFATKKEIKINCYFYCWYLGLWTLQSKIYKESAIFLRVYFRSTSEMPTLRSYPRRLFDFLTFGPFRHQLHLDISLKFCPNFSKFISTQFNLAQLYSL